MYMFVIDNITVIKGWLINEFLKDISLDQTGRHFSVVLYLNLVYSKKNCEYNAIRYWYQFQM